MLLELIIILSLLSLIACDSFKQGNVERLKKLACGILGVALFMLVYLALCLVF